VKLFPRRIVSDFCNSVGEGGRAAFRQHIYISSTRKTPAIRPENRIANPPAVINKKSFSIPIEPIRLFSRPSCLQCDARISYISIISVVSPSANRHTRVVCLYKTLQVARLLNVVYCNIQSVRATDNYILDREKDRFIIIFRPALNRGLFSRRRGKNVLIGFFSPPRIKRLPVAGVEKPLFSS